MTDAKTEPARDMERLTAEDRLRLHVHDPDTFAFCYEDADALVEEIDALRSPTPPPIGDGEGPKPVAWMAAVWIGRIEEGDDALDAVIWKGPAADGSRVPLYDHSTVEALRAERTRANEVITEVSRDLTARITASEAQVSTLSRQLEEAREALRSMHRRAQKAEAVGQATLAQMRNWIEYFRLQRPARRERYLFLYAVRDAIKAGEKAIRRAKDVSHG